MKLRIYSGEIDAERIEIVYGFSSRVFLYRAADGALWYRHAQEIGGLWTDPEAKKLSASLTFADAREWAKARLGDDLLTDAWKWSSADGAFVRAEDQSAFGS